jgi:tetratricopeptide (TPR) repeat protein
VYLEANDIEKAKDAFRKALERSPGNIDALIGLGTCYSRAGEFKSACDVMEQAHRALPQSVRIALSLSDAYVELGQKVAAIKLLRETKAAASAQGLFVKPSAARRGPSSLPPPDAPAPMGSPMELLHRLGALYLESGWPKKARSEWREMLDLWNGDLREGARVFEALVFFREVREGLRLMQAWLKRHRPTPDVDFLLMLCHVLQRDQTRFWIAWQKVWKEQPTLLESRANFLKSILNRSDVQFLLAQMPRTHALFSSFPDTMQRIAGLQEYLGRIQAIEPITELSP